MNKKTIILEEISKDQIISIFSSDENNIFSEIDLSVTVYFGRSLSLGYKFNTLNDFAIHNSSSFNEICFKSKGRLALVILETTSDKYLNKITVQAESMNLA